MNLDDTKLAFAHDLVAHWTQIRGGDLVPLKQAVDPAQMTRALPFITIVDLSKPGALVVRLAGTGLRQRYGQDITQANWLDFVPPERKRRVDMIRRLLLSQPCGIYYRFKIACPAQVTVEAETVTLPLRPDAASAPGMVISLSRDIAIQGIVDATAMAAAQLQQAHSEFIDIGAGIPALLPAAALAAE